MMFCRLLITFLASSLPLLAASAFTGGITPNEFQALVEDSDLVIAAFTSPASDVSQRIVAELQAASNNLRQPIVSLDCSHHEDFCKEQDINAYPAIRLYRSATEFVRYRGSRRAASLVSFVTRTELPVMSEVTPLNFEGFRAVDDVVFIGFFDAESQNLAAIYEEVAKLRHDSFAFGATSDTDLAKLNDFPIPSVVCYKRRENDSTRASGQFDKDSLTGFIDSTAPYNIVDITQKSIQKLVQSGKPVAYIFTEKESQNEDLRLKLTAVAKKYKQYITFGFIDANEYGFMAESMELRADKYPAFAMLNVIKDEVHTYDQDTEIDTGSVEEMVIAVLQGKAKPGVFVGTRDREDAHDEL